MNHSKTLVLVIIAALVSMSVCMLLEAVTTSDAEDQACHNQAPQPSPKGHQIDLCCEQQALYVQQFHSTCDNSVVALLTVVQSLTVELPIAQPSLLFVPGYRSNADHLAQLSILRI